MSIYVWYYRPQKREPFALRWMTVVVMLTVYASSSSVSTGTCLKATTERLSCFFNNVTVGLVFMLVLLLIKLVLKQSDFGDDNDDDRGDCACGVDGGRHR